MSPRSFILLGLLMPLLFACEQKPKVITPQLVENFLKEVDAASVKRDPSVLIDHMAPEALITIKMTGPTGPKTDRMNGKDFQTMLKAKMPVLKDYKYQRSDTKIEISTDQKHARATMKTSEVMTAPNGTYRAEGKQTCVYFLKDGKLLIQSVDSEINATLGK